MKIKKMFSKIIVIGICMIASMLAATSVNAATETNLILGLEEYRSSGLAYMTEERIAWKISSYSSLTSTTADQTRTIYCIKGGPGFGSTDMGSNSIIKRNYTKSFNLKDYDAIGQVDGGIYQAVLPSGENYNSLVWVLEHCYVPAKNISEVENAKIYRDMLLEEAEISENSTISDDEIDIAQQLAVWYFTNNDNYKITNETFSLWVKSLEDNEYRALGDKFVDGDDRNEDAIKLFLYLVNGGIQNKNVAPNVNSSEGTISLIDEDAVAVKRENNFVVGPYRLEINAKDYYIETTLTNSLGNEISYTPITDDEQTNENVIVFYLQIPVTEDINGATLALKMIQWQANLTYWSVAGANTTEQPVVEIERISKETSVSTTMREQIFDLALRKYITKVDGVVLTNTRVPNIDTSTIKTDNMAIYKHRKDSVPVKNGSKIIYNITVYNEGEQAGYATKVVDKLATGLKFTRVVSGNYELLNYDEDENEVTLVRKTGIDALNPYDGETLSSETIEIECEVTALPDAQNSKVLTNVAYIYEAYNSENNETITNEVGKDIDSEPATIPNVNKDNMSDYKGNNSNKEDLSDNNYFYKGEQDDDDFEKVVILPKQFDLALRKFITNINGEELVDQNEKYLREPTIDVSKLINDASVTTADYKHEKSPKGAKIGDIVIYTIRIYNEGEKDGYASKVTDYLPPELEFVMDDEENFNASYGWVVDNTLRKASSTKLTKDIIDSEENLIKAFDKDTMTEPDYVELKIKCRVKSTVEPYDIITNIAEITECKDAEGNIVNDRDSIVNNIVLPTDEDLPDYKGNTSNKSILTDKTYHYKGQEDDDDFEKLIIEEFDLALRKFITQVNDERVTNRVPVFTKNKDANGNYIYEHTKEPIDVETADIVEYTIRIFNEGNIAGYAKEIKDNIPEGLEFLPQNSTNREYRWVMLDEENNQTDDVSKAVSIVTDYLSKEQENTSGENLLIAFNQDTMVSPDYRDVKVKFKVIAPNNYEGIITNIAEISDDSDENGNEITDIDSTPNNNEMTEDDIDIENLKLTYFDLALRKFITAVNNEEITNRYPVFKVNENGEYVYEHTKEPVEVVNGNIVTYTIRVYNEGKKAGYAKEVKDDIPEGLEFLPENNLNTEYRWVMLDEEDNQTEDISKAVSIVTDYLSKAQEIETDRDNLLDKFDLSSMEEPDYRDVKVAFKVTEPNTSDRIIINKAQISDDSDKKGNDVIDSDSTPNRWIEGEDDQDIEKVKVKYFDLALRKWVTEAIVIQDGKEVITETGHKAEDDPEEVVKVEIVESKLNKVVVKFKYKIRVTNEGEIPGYVDEISDYIPEGLTFVKADNPNWEEVEGKVVTDMLKDTLLNPGESAEVEILLTWINGKNNLGLKINVAEISKDRNDSNSKDIDSTPNNKVEGEDDIDDAPVILTIKTGAGIDITYIILVVGAITIISLGVIFIKKYVL